MSREAMKLALEALEAITVDVKTTPTAYEAQRQAITALREALAEQPAQQSCYCLNCEELSKQVTALKLCVEVERGFHAQEQPAQQEPVACFSVFRSISGERNTRFLELASLPDGEHYFYTSPPAQRTWVSLTDEEIDDLSREMVKGNKSVNWLSYSIEAKLRSKNQ